MNTEQNLLVLIWPEFSEDVHIERYSRREGSRVIWRGGLEEGLAIFRERGDGIEEIEETGEKQKETGIWRALWEFVRRVVLRVDLFFGKYDWHKRA